MTRQSIFNICEQIDIKCRAKAIPTEDLRAADEVFITSTAGGVMPVTKVDGIAIGSGAIGPLTKQITEVYWQMHNDDKCRDAISYQSNTA